MSSDSYGLGLPYWFSRPVPQEQEQLSLFHISLDELLVRLRISPDELVRWHARGWISFAASSELEIDEIADPKAWELSFVRDIVRSGLSDAQIAWLLEAAPKPYAFHPDRVAFSFRHGWVEAVPCKEPETDIEANLESWLVVCDEDELLNLRGKIDELLRVLGNPDLEIEA